MLPVTTTIAPFSRSGVAAETSAGMTTSASSALTVTIPARRVSLLAQVRSVLGTLELLETRDSGEQHAGRFGGPGCGQRGRGAGGTLERADLPAPVLPDEGDGLRPPRLLRLDGGAAA